MSNSPLFIKGISIFVLAGVALLLFNCVGGSTPQRFEFTEQHMGTDLTLTFYAPDSLTASSASKAAFKRVEELNGILSDYEPDSELSELSRSSGTGEALPVSQSLYFVLQTSLEISSITDGAFDITIGPFVQLWRQVRRTQRQVSDQQLENARDRVGYQYVELDSANKTVHLLKNEMRLDAGSIGKGYASDEVIAELRKFDITSALVDFGGDIAVGDPPPGKDGWTIAYTIGAPGNTTEQAISTMANTAVATSGDLFQFIELEGVRYSHIINPKTGLGITDQSTVTVIARSAMTADAYSTAFSVLGPERSLEIAKKIDGLEFHFIRKEKDEIKTWQSRGFVDVQ